MFILSQSYEELLNHYIYFHQIDKRILPLVLTVLIQEVVADVIGLLLLQGKEKVMGF